MVVEADIRRDLMDRVYRAAIFQLSKGFAQTLSLDESGDAAELLKMPIKLRARHRQQSA